MYGLSPWAVTESDLLKSENQWKVLCGCMEKNTLWALLWVVRLTLVQVWSIPRDFDQVPNEHSGPPYGNVFQTTPADFPLFLALVGVASLLADWVQSSLRGGHLQAGRKGHWGSRRVTEGHGGSLRVTEGHSGSLRVTEGRAYEYMHKWPMSGPQQVGW